MSIDVFDYIIIGAGSAGSLLAARLAEDGNTTVCVLESGPPDRHPFLHIPAGFIKAINNPALTWQFRSEPTQWTGGRQVTLPQGRTLGGSSSINGMIYNRGQRMDYDVWAQRGNRGWGYADVLPYFRRCERRLSSSDGSTEIDERYRSNEGNLSVSDIDWKHPLTEAFIDGVVGLGIPRNPDHNAAEQAGVGYFQRTINRTRRASSARAFLHPAKRSAGDRIDIRTNSQVISILLKDHRAIGVSYMKGGRDGTPIVIHARREVILCAGTINSPRLLQLSGIGPAALLKEIGIGLQVEVPGVGENLQDHYAVRMVSRAKNVDSINSRARMPRLALEVLNWSLRRPSIMGLSPSLVHVFWKSNEALNLPDLQFVFTPASYKEGSVGLLDNFPGMTCGVWQHRPDSSGYVRIRSIDAFDYPTIQPNYLAAEHDRRVLVAGMRLARKFYHTPQLAPYYEREELPGDEAQSDDELLSYAYSNGSTAFHLVGTCRMGPASDPNAVVDDQLRVRGVEGLRVVDASVMPAVTSGNTNAPTMMIAEKAADMIRGRSPLPAAGV